jgi:hypothetical protein
VNDKSEAAYRPSENLTVAAFYEREKRNVSPGWEFRDVNVKK